VQSWDNPIVTKYEQTRTLMIFGNFWINFVLHGPISMNLGYFFNWIFTIHGLNNSNK